MTVDTVKSHQVTCPKDCFILKKLAVNYLIKIEIREFVVSKYYVVNTYK